MGLRDPITSAKHIVVQVDAGALVQGEADATLRLGVLGSLVDQAHACAAERSADVGLIISGDAAIVEPAVGAALAMLGWKAGQGAGSVTVKAAPSSSGIAAGEAVQGAGALLHLSLAPGIPSSGKQGGVVAVYVPPTAGSEANSAGPGAEVVASAWAAAQAGLPVVLASATEPNVVTRFWAGEAVGTLFTAAAAEAVAAPAQNGSASAAGVREAAVRARAASRTLQALPAAARVAMLYRVADALLAAQDEILAENARDMADATQNKVADALLQRLALKPAKLQQLADGIRAIAAQDEPIGQIVRRMELAEGLVLDKTTAPIGVLLVIFEARPDALPQIAALAIRSGNGLLLKGGKEAARSNAILHRTIVQAIGSELGSDLINLVTTREQISELLALDDVIDLVIPRGGNALVTHIQRSTRIPVLGHADGICHAYIDAAADLDMACKIVVDGKTDYPAACNAIEKVLVHTHWLTAPGSGERSGVARLRAALEAAGVTVHGGERSVAELGLPPAPSARHEYSSMDVTLELVDGLQQAVDHIHANGSGHTEVIVTQDDTVAASFLALTDAACVLHNASTRFSDGFRFGLGAEVGISTSRIHARGPVGVEGLMTTKWVLRGQGQIVAKDKGVAYTHRLLPLH